MAFFCLHSLSFFLSSLGGGKNKRMKKKENNHSATRFKLFLRSVFSFSIESDRMVFFFYVWQNKNHTNEANTPIYKL